MDKEQMYKNIAELLLQKLIILQKDFNKIAHTMEKICNENKISACIELGDFIPMVDLAKYLGLSSDDEENKMYGALYELIDKCKKKDLNLKDFFEKYI